MTSHKRRKRRDDQIKLPLGTHVEVRHSDQGLKGSWHPGVVVDCKKSIRLVEYTNLLDDDGSSKLIERISVSAAIDGGVAFHGVRKNYRGYIRPRPLTSLPQIQTFTCGLCVDALVNDAWWEGVIFDTEEGSKERLVFFPDQGDQDWIDVHCLRVTQDWDEVSGDWKPRGDWLFIRMLEKHKSFLPVSIRQIWYDVRASNDYKHDNLDWMHEDRDLWDKMVSEAVQENFCAAYYGQAVTLADSEFAEIGSEYPCDNCLPICKDVSLIFQSNPSLSTPNSAASATLQLMNGGLIDESTGYTDAYLEGGAFVSHNVSLALPLNMVSAYTNVAKNLHPYCIDFCSNDALVTNNTIVIYGSKFTERLFSYHSLQNEMAGIPAESMLEYDGTSSNGEAAGAVHPLENGKDSEDVVGVNLVDNSITSADQGAESLKLAVAYSPAIRKYCASGMRQCHKDTASDVKKLLQCMGWIIKYKKVQNSPKGKTVYVSPGGKTYYSLHQVFKLKKQAKQPGRSVNGQICWVVNNNIVSDYEDADSYNVACGRNGVSEALNEVYSWKPFKKCDLPMPEFFPSAVAEYCSIVAGRKSSIQCTSRQSCSEKAKKHLLFMGWKVEMRKDMKKSVRIRYVSPDNIRFMSLHQACKHMLSNGNKWLSSRNEWETVFNQSLCESDCPEVSTAEELGGEELCTVSCHKNQASSTRQIYRLDSKADAVSSKQEISRQAVTDYLKCMTNGRKGCSVKMKEIEQFRLEVKDHLVAEGWRLSKKPKRLCNRVKYETCYTSPSGKQFMSLLKVCETWLKSHSVNKKGKVHVAKVRSQDLLDNNKSTMHHGCEELLHSPSTADSKCSSDLLNWGGLGSARAPFKGIRTQRKRRGLSFSLFEPELLCNEKNTHFSSHRIAVDNAGVQDDLNVAALGNKRQTLRGVSAAKKLKRRRSACASTVRGVKAKSRSSMPVLRSSNRGPHMVGLSSSKQTIRSVLSWLIDNDVVLPRQKVWYRNPYSHHILAEGQITHKGIKCKCCKKVYSLSRFQVHAGSKDPLPAANIFLEDGRSILQCQMQIMSGSKFRCLKSDAYQRTKGDYTRCKSDNICSICHYGGDLILCDYCPSSFHPSCIGLKDVPEGKWSCSSCRCGICGESEYNADFKEFTAKSVLYCDQCEQEFHVGCLRKRGLLRLQGLPQGNWFCGKKCSKIFLYLQKLVGKSKPTIIKGLSWTILRSNKVNYYEAGASDVEITTEHHSKLCVAVSVLHECFVPLVEPRTKSDIVTDILFNRRSELKRLNFRGFYTLILERGDEMISVAAIRIHGAKVAEVPLVGTRIQYRRQGMCRLLLNELEKMLSNLGVERLLLPAAAQLLDTWTKSFGFTKMTSSDRLQFLGNTFLDFQDTTMCQKVLIPLALKATETRVTRLRIKFGCNEKGDSMAQPAPEPLQILGPVLALPVRPVSALPSVDVQKSDKIIETSSVSILGSDCGSDCLPCTEETNQVLQGELDYPTTTDVGAGEDSISADVTEMISPVTSAEVRDLGCRFRGLYYQRKKVNRKPCSFDNLGLNNNALEKKILKFYTRRYTSAPEKSSESFVS